MVEEVGEVEKGKEGTNTSYQKQIDRQIDKLAGRQQNISISSTEEEKKRNLPKFYNYNLNYLIPVCDYYHS